MSLKYKIYKERFLLVDVLNDTITASKLYEFHKYYRNDPKIFEVYKVLTNLIGADFKMTFDEMMDYVEELKREPLPPNFKWAILTETPNSTMFSILVKEDPHFKNKVEVFSTLKASLNYLNVEFKENDFDDDDYVTMS